MRAIHTPLILYIPGLLPKPEPAIHKQALHRCLLEGVRRADAAIADEIRTSDHSFDLVAWTYDFYREHRDYAIDRDAVDAVLEQTEATARDISEATSWSRRLALAVFRLGDLLPFLIRHLATEKMELHLRDLHRYVRNSNGIADHAREMLKVALRAAWESHRPTLLIGHSMGSVIAYDSLWEMSHRDGDELVIDLLLTMGSPLGQSYLQKRIKGCSEQGERRYPRNIRRWINLSAVGEMTALDPELADDFAEMQALGLIERIEDRPLFNYFRLDGQLNVHAEYGYLVNADTGRIVADWWREQAAAAT
ncbi:MAG: hypothetical protein R3288_00895 [Woeseiaceae bacterium]|nr:hypothetical protein [Woeseiaceae bacterium]